MNKNKSVYRVITVLGKTFTLFVDFFNQWRVFLIYALALTLISALCGNWSYSCLTGNDDFWCREAAQGNSVKIVLYLCYFIVSLLLYFLFMTDLCSVKKGEKIAIRQIANVGWQKLKKCGFLFLYLLGIVIPIAIGMLIMQRPAIPDWRVEFIFFLITFTMFVIPLLVIRFSAAVGCFLRDSTLPQLQSLYNLTKGKSYIPLLTMLGLILIISLLNIKLVGAMLYLVAGLHNFGMALLTEFIQHIAILIYFALVTAFCLGQAEILDIQQEIDKNQSSEKIKERK